MMLSERETDMWYMRDYDIERPDSDYPDYDEYFDEDEEDP